MANAALDAMNKDLNDPETLESLKDGGIELFAAIATLMPATLLLKLNEHILTSREGETTIEALRRLREPVELMLLAKGLSMAVAKVAKDAEEEAGE